MIFVKLNKTAMIRGMGKVMKKDLRMGKMLGKEYQKNKKECLILMERQILLRQEE